MGSTSEVFGIDDFGAEIKRAVAKITKMEDAVSASRMLRDAVNEAAEILRKEQKRIISQKYPDFAEYISISVSGHGNGLKAYVGYNGNVIKEHPETVIIEFGRPGTKGVKQGGKDKLGRKIGVIQPYSCIRGSLFNKKDEVKKYLAERLLDEVNRIWAERA